MLDPKDYLDQQVQDLIDEYSKSKTHLEKAKLEKTLKRIVYHKLAKTKEASTINMRILMKAFFKGSSRMMEGRSYILNNYSDLAWKLADVDNVSIHTVQCIVKEAKDIHEIYGTPFESAVEVVNSNYEFVGTKYVKIKIPKSKKEAPTADHVSTSKTFDDWESIYEGARCLLEKDIVDDDVFKKYILNNFKIELKNLIFQYKKKIEQKTELNTDCKFISSKQLGEACEILSMKVPKASEPADLKILKKKFRFLALEYHPDRNDGDIEKTRLFHKVNEAYATIMSYNSMIERNENA